MAVDIHTRISGEVFMELMRGEFILQQKKKYNMKTYNYIVHCLEKQSYELAWCSIILNGARRY